MPEHESTVDAPASDDDVVPGTEEDVEGHGAREVVAGLGVVVALGAGSSGAALGTDPSISLGSGPVRSAVHRTSDMVPDQAGAHATVRPATVRRTPARGAVATETRVVSAAPRAFAGQAVTFTAAVAAQELRAAMPTGTITFLDGDRELGTAGLGQGGTASITVVDLPAGEHSVTAVFSGDDLFSRSDADPISQRVMRSSTVTTVRSSVGSNDAVTLTAQVASTSPGGVRPTGTVSFWSGTEQIGVVATAPDGTATLTTAAGRLGAHQVYARYAGDASNRASQSNPMVAVEADPAEVALAPTTVGAVRAGQATADVDLDEVSLSRDG